MTSNWCLNNSEAMGTIQEHFGNLLNETQELSKHITEADEFVAVNDIRRVIEDSRENIKNLELKIYEARKVFERTKDIATKPDSENKDKT